MRIFFIVGIFALLASAGFGQNVRSVPEAELRLRDELESDVSIEQVSCWSRGKIPASEDLRRRKLAFDIFQSATGSAKLKQICSTVEGTRAALYLLIDKGNARLIGDSSRDKFGYMRVIAYDCSKLMAGRYRFDNERRSMVFTPITTGEKFEGDTRFFQCESGDKMLIF